MNYIKIQYPSNYQETSPVLTADISCHNSW